MRKGAVSPDDDGPHSFLPFFFLYPTPTSVVLRMEIAYKSAAPSASMSKFITPSIDGPAIETRSHHTHIISCASRKPTRLSIRHEASRDLASLSFHGHGTAIGRSSSHPSHPSQAGHRRFSSTDQKLPAWPQILLQPNHLRSW